MGREKKVSFVLFFLLFFAFGLLSCTGGNSGITGTKLATPTLTLNDDIASWNDINNASKYEISLSGTLFFLENSITTKKLNDGDSLKVRAVGDDKAFITSEWSNTVTYSSNGNGATLSIPSVVISEQGVASWNAVDNASGYVYKINNGQEQTTNSLSVQLSSGQFIVVKAKGNGTTYSDSAYSSAKSFTTSDVVEPTYLGICVSNNEPTESMERPQLNFANRYATTTTTEDIISEYYTNESNLMGDNIPQASEYNAYSEIGHTVYVQVWLNNPSQHTILSLKLNGIKYQVGGGLSSFFKEEDSKHYNCIYVAITIPNNSYDEIKYTVSDIEYINDTYINSDGTDAFMNSHNSISVGLPYKSKPNCTGDFNSAIFDTQTYKVDLSITDSDNVLTKSKAFIRAVIFKNQEIVDQKKISAGSNSLEFTNLNSNTTYNLVVFAIYDLHDGNGTSIQILSKNSFTTTTYANLNATTDYHAFDNGDNGAEITITKDTSKEEINKLEIISPSNKVIYTLSKQELNDINTDGTITIFDGLLNNTEYIVKSYYSDDKTETSSIKTLELGIPDIIDIGYNDEKYALADELIVGFKMEYLKSTAKISELTMTIYKNYYDKLIIEKIHTCDADMVYNKGHIKDLDYNNGIEMVHFDDVEQYYIVVDDWQRINSIWKQNYNSMDTVLNVTCDLNDGAGIKTFEIVVNNLQFEDPYFDYEANEKPYNIKVEGNKKVTLEYNLYNYPENIYLAADGFITNSQSELENMSIIRLDHKYWSYLASATPGAYSITEWNYATSTYNEDDPVFKEAFDFESFSILPRYSGNQGEAGIGTNYIVALGKKPVLEGCDELVLEIKNKLEYLNTTWLNNYLALLNDANTTTLHELDKPSYDITFTKEINVDMSAYPLGNYQFLTNVFHNPQTFEEYDNNGQAVISFTSESFPKDQGYFYPTGARIYSVKGYLDTPTNVKFENGELTWNPVENASSYNVIFKSINNNGENVSSGVETTTNSVTIGQIMSIYGYCEALNDRISVTIIASDEKEFTDENGYVSTKFDYYQSDASDSYKIPLIKLENVPITLDNTYNQDSEKVVVYTFTDNNKDMPYNIYYSINNGEWMKYDLNKVYYKYIAEATIGDVVKIKAVGDNCLTADSDITTFTMDFNTDDYLSFDNNEVIYTSNQLMESMFNILVDYKINDGAICNRTVSKDYPLSVSKNEKVSVRLSITLKDSQYSLSGFTSPYTTEWKEFIGTEDVPEYTLSGFGKVTIKAEENTKYGYRLISSYDSHASEMVVLSDTFEFTVPQNNLATITKLDSEGNPIGWSTQFYATYSLEAPTYTIDGTTVTITADPNGYICWNYKEDFSDRNSNTTTITNVCAGDIITAYSKFKNTSVQDSDIVRIVIPIENGKNVNYSRVTDLNSLQIGTKIIIANNQYGKVAGPVSNNQRSLTSVGAIFNSDNSMLTCIDTNVMIFTVDSLDLEDGYLYISLKNSDSKYLVNNSNNILSDESSVFEISIDNSNNESTITLSNYNGNFRFNESASIFKFYNNSSNIQLYLVSD